MLLKEHVRPIFQLFWLAADSLESCPELSERHKVVTASFSLSPFLRGCSQVSALSSDLWEEPACTSSGLMWRPACGPQGAQSSGKWFAELPSDISCLALINSCHSVKLGIRLWHWLRPAPSRFRSACLAHSEERSGQRSTAKQLLFSFSTDPTLWIPKLNLWHLIIPCICMPSLGPFNGYYGNKPYWQSC